jgi:hypothetical protein
MHHRDLMDLHGMREVKSSSIIVGNELNNFGYYSSLSAFACSQSTIYLANKIASQSIDEHIL